MLFRSKANTDLPVSVKLRAVEKSEVQSLVGFTRKLTQGGVSWVTLHPRTAEQKRRGSADWEQIRRLKQQCLAEQFDKEGSV